MMSIIQTLILIISLTEFSRGSQLICGKIKINDDSFGKIVGGEEVSLGEIPWIASLKKFGNHLCGAAVIHDQWLITASHCVADLSTLELIIDAGKLHLNQNETTEQSIPVSEYFLHPNYSYDGMNYFNDIALLKLTRRLDLSAPFVQPICLPKWKRQNFTAVQCYLSGWGSTTEHGSMSELLRKVNVPIISDEECQKKYQFHVILENMLCSWNQNGGKDSCQGDSGGPLSCLIDDTYFLAGVVSWGIGCGRVDFPSINTEVSYFLSWIEDTIIQNQ